MTAPDTQPETTVEAAPEVPKLHPVRWMQENLFSSPASTVLTVITVAGVLFVSWWILNELIFEETRQWGSVPTNMRLYMTLAYPVEDYLRIWISLGVVLSLAGLSMRAWPAEGRTSLAQLARAALYVGIGVTLVSVLAPWSTRARVVGLIVAAAFIVVSLGSERVLGERREITLGTPALLGAFLVVVLGAMWVADAMSEQIDIASSTKQPLTVMAVVLAVAYVVGGPLIARVTEARARPLLVGLWLLSMPVIYLHIMRAPGLSRVEGGFFGSENVIWTQQIRLAFIFAVVGGAIRWFVSAPGRRDLASATSAVLGVLALVIWFIPQGPVPDLMNTVVFKVLLALLAVVTIGASTFGGTNRARTQLVIAWVVMLAFLTYMFALGTMESTLELQSDFLGGLSLTLLLASAGILLSFPIGVMLALGRTSSLPIFRLLSTSYIEVVRGVPLITVLFFGAFFLPLFLPGDIRVADVMKSIIAIALFSAAYLAENVRGGLQSIPTGQYEAARAVGMTTAQMTIFITLPQALRVVIPALVGQVIALFKDTSLVAIIGLADIPSTARQAPRS